MSQNSKSFTNILVQCRRIRFWKNIRSQKAEFTTLAEKSYVQAEKMEIEIIYRSTRYGIASYIY